jgi:hypothetical protein
MPEYIEEQNHRRVDTRREVDREFTDCPKYARHELNREQMKELIEDVVEVVLLKIDSPDRKKEITKELVEEVFLQMKVGVFNEGKGILIHVVTFLGIAAYALYAWLSNHPFK